MGTDQQKPMGIEGYHCSVSSANKFVAAAHHVYVILRLGFADI